MWRWALGDRPKVLDLFAGCGGLSTGFEKAGFDVFASNDIWGVALETFKSNHPGTKAILGNIMKKSVQDEIIDIVNHKVDIIIGGPPCQAYSLAGSRDPEDPRGKLFENYVKIVEKVQPSVFVVENVKGILSMKHFKENIPIEEKKEIIELIKMKKSKKQKVSIENLNKQIEEYLVPVPELIKSTFEGLGYKVEWRLLNTADYGVPQERQRVFFLGTKYKNIVFPHETHSGKSSSLLKSYVTLREAISDLPFPDIGDEDEVYEGGFSPIYMSRNRRRSWNEVSYTIQAGARHIPLHPGCPPMEKIDSDNWIFGQGPFRRLSVKECARIQTFPDDYIFIGKTVDKYKQIGNAVPPLLAMRVGSCVRKML